MIGAGSGSGRRGSSGNVTKKKRVVVVATVGRRRWEEDKLAPELTFMLPLSVVTWASVGARRKRVEEVDQV